MFIFDPPPLPSKYSTYISLSWRLETDHWSKFGLLVPAVIFSHNKSWDDGSLQIMLLSQSEAATVLLELIDSEPRIDSDSMINNVFNDII